MTYTFKSKTSLLFRAVLLISLAAMLYLFWFRMIIPAAVVMVLNVYLIRSFLHTEYLLSEEGLHIQRGYLKPIDVKLAEIESVEEGGAFCSLAACARASVTVTAKGVRYGLSPQRPDLFLKRLNALRSEL